MRILWTGVAALALTMPAAAQSLGDQVQQQMPSLMTIYKDLHANPELSFMEVRSAGILAAEARKLGFDVTEKVGGTGVVAVMKNGPGPVVLVRADMDGLPVTEQTGLPGASKVRVTTKEGVETGVMHACGHDTHMTSWIGTARLMAANKDKWSGTLVMIGQPAEERGAGDARRWALYPLSEAAICARLPRRGAVSGRSDRLHAGLCARQCR
jgi:hippurate hydrolase